MHFVGIAHNDLKLQNIMFNRQKELKIIDFGCSKKIDIYKKGTVLYMAPEK